MTHSVEYRIWGGIIDRCENPDGADWEHYGGRGISVCDEWRRNFEAFYRDMGPRPSAKMSVDRIDNDGPYAPGNCRWATATQQRRNSRQRLHLLTHNGETLPLCEWSKRLQLNHATLIRRFKRGLPASDVLSARHL